MFTYRLKSKTVLADRYTPVNAYIKVRDISPQSCLMESSDYHGEENSHSFIGFNPIASISVNHGKVRAAYPDGSVEDDLITDDCTPEDAISRFMAQFSVEGDASGYCGLYGYTAFDAVKYFEHIKVMDEPAERNLFAKPNEQNDACINSAMARKGGCEETKIIANTPTKLKVC